MLNSTKFALILITIAALSGVVLSWSQLDQESSSATASSSDLNSTQGMMDHSHMPINIPDNAPTPQISLSIYPDIMGGYNLLLDLENYRLIPPPNSMKMATLMSASMDEETGYIEGHAHLYVNGIKIQRVYSDALYLPESLFHDGVNQLTITLNNHAHMHWVADKKQLLASISFKDDGKPSIIHRISSNSN